jgi:gamma-polyglutamate biosynthesis protein CapA
MRLKIVSLIILSILGLFSFAWGTMTIVEHGLSKLFLHAPGEQQIDDTVSMLAFGDMMLARDIRTKMDRYGDDYPFEKISSLFGQYDILTANFEGAISSQSSHEIKPHFGFDVEGTASLLKHHGFNLFNLANNHGDDFGLEGIELTHKLLWEQGIDTVGNPSNDFDYDLLEGELNGIRFAFIGINETYKNVDWDFAFSQMKKLKERNDFLITFIHWGDEYETEQNEWQIDRGHTLIDHGADLVIGSHPHVIQGKEFYKKRWIYYSLGNFIFDQYFSEETQEGLALDVSFEKSGQIVVKEKYFDIVAGQPRWRPGQFCKDTCN